MASLYARGFIFCLYTFWVVGTRKDVESSGRCHGNWDRIGSYEPCSKLLKGGYRADYIGNSLCGVLCGMLGD